MIRLFRYLKPYVASIILVIALLFIQANADLALPDYMSKIVNIGIQQSGISDAVPVVIRQSEMEKILLLLLDVERTSVLEAYSLVESTSSTYSSLQAQYPGARDTPLFTLNAISMETRDRLNIILSVPLSLVSLIDQAATDPEKARTMMLGMPLDMARMPSGTDLFGILKTLPESQKASILSSLRDKFEALDPMLREQMGIRAVRAEYEALGANMSALQNSYILKIGALMILLTLISVTATILVGFLGARTAAGLARDLRGDVFRKVENFSFSELDHFSTASLITRSTNDITQIQMVVIMGLRMIFYAPIIGIGGVMRATAKASTMWWIIALAVGVLLLIIGTVFKIAIPKFKSIQKLIDRLNLIVRENLSGMMVIRAFTMQGYEEKRFGKANRDLTGTMLFVTRVMVVLMPMMMLIMNLVSLLIIWTGAHEVANSQIRIGDMMAFMQYSMQIFFAFIMLSMMFIILPRASVSADRIADVLAEEPQIKDPEKPLHYPEPFKGTISFKNVIFRYPGSSEDVLNQISFDAKPGQTTAILGTTGAGKSTLVSLIPRFYDVTEGSIEIDGIDVRKISQKELRDRIGFVPQKGSLFSGTIESNLRYANENATLEEIQTALDIAQASEFVHAKPEGIKAEISQGGINVSGGQRQRLTIARALVKNTPIYIFDDSFSALDFKTDMNLRQALKSRVKDSTVILVTQRVATIKHADQIIVLDEGRMVGIGTHQQLMENCEVYRDIALSQLKQEELA